jgi:hypothetical protein
VPGRRLVIISEASNRGLPGTGPRAARDIYGGRPWDLRKRYAEAFADEWLVISATYGLVRPTDRLEPGYKEGSLTTPQLEERLKSQAREFQLGRFGLIEILAGRDYVDAILKCFGDLTDRVFAPLDGLSMGDRSLAIHRRILAREPFEPD